MFVFTHAVSNEQARAESSKLNLHIDLAYAQPIIGPLTSGDGPVDDEIRRGMAGWANLEWQFDSPWGAEATIGLGYLWETSDFSTQIGDSYTNVAFGLRYRFIDDNTGYQDQSWGNWWGNGWAAVHAGFQHLDGTQFGFDLAAGYEFSVVHPLQLGVFAKWQVGFGGKRSSADSILFLGITGSLEILDEDGPVDSDGDGLVDREEERLGTDPFDADTDSDGIRDNVELETKTDPLIVDTDNDGISDGIEDRNRNGRVDEGETDPRLIDTDKGGISDSDEATMPGQNPRDPSDDDVDGDGVANPYDRCAGTPSKTEVNDFGCATGQKPQVKRGIFTLEGLEFKPNSAALGDGAEKALNEAYKYLFYNEGVSVEIRGHTDDRGARRRNRLLSLRRAKAVRDFLIDRGIDESRLFVRGFGESKPKVPNVDAESRATNRRIEFRVMSNK